MGTSNSNGGAGGRTPLIPSWLGSGDGDSAFPPDNEPNGNPPGPMPPIPPPAAADRFTIARSNFSQFARSGGNDRASLGRAVSKYVSTAAGGSRTAAQRMGASRTAGSRLLGVLSHAAASTPREALRALNLENLAGRPIEQVFLGLADYVCPDGGTIDEGIAREAFIETIADLAANDITSFDSLTTDQVHTIYELYVTHAIEARLCNDIGAKAITLPADPTAVGLVQRQLFDFIRRSVADALTSARSTMRALTTDRIVGFVTQIYEQAFFIMQTMGEEAAR